MSDDSDRIRRRLPDYFKVIGEPWHFAVGLLAEFVTDEEEKVTESGHVRNLFHVAKALDEENVTLRAQLMDANHHAATVFDLFRTATSRLLKLEAQLREAQGRFDGVLKSAKEAIRQHGLCGWDCNWCDLANALAEYEATLRPSPQAAPSEPKPCPTCAMPGVPHEKGCAFAKPQATAGVVESRTEGGKEGAK